MSHPDGELPRPRRVFDFDTLLDYAGVFLAVPFIIFVTWLILNPTHFSLPLIGRHIDELVTAGVLDASIFFIVAGGVLLLRRPPTGLVWKVLTLGIFMTLCAGCCWLIVELLNYWWQPK